ncbi:MAG: PPOX class F420-dependent oxidoreductase [Acidimicrobiales bacterium]
MPDTSSVIPATHADILEKKGFAHVATVGSHGEPQSSPVWYGWDGHVLSFSQTTGRQKYHNLGKEPRIALSVTDPENPYRYIEIRGVVEGIDEDPDNAFINSMAKKYLDEDVYPWHKPEDHRVIVRVRPERTTIQ